MAGVAGSPDVVVIGGGVVGLTTAIRLQEAGYSVTVVAGSFQETCSHSAASWFIPDPEYGTGHGSSAAGFNGDLYRRWATRTWEVMSADVGGEGAATQLTRGTRLFTAAGAPDGMPTMLERLWYLRETCLEFREMAAAEVAAYGRPELVGGVTFKTLTTDMRAYLSRLRDRIEAGGGRLVEQRISSLEAGFALYPKARCWVHCSGIGARELCGEQSMIGVRGQTALVKAEQQSEFLSVVTGDKRRPVYVVPQGNGNVILGGCKIPGDSAADPDLVLAEEITNTAVSWCPALRDHEFIRHVIGWRPFREQGVRLELDRTATVPVVHNYGHGDVGVILAWGCADDAARLVASAMELQEGATALRT